MKEHDLSLKCMKIYFPHFAYGCDGKPLICTPIREIKFLMQRFHYPYELPFTNIENIETNPIRGLKVSKFLELHDSTPRFVGPSVRPSVHPSDVRLSHFTFLGFLRSLALLLLQVNSITAPVHPHATGIAVYPTWFIAMTI